MEVTNSPSDGDYEPIFDEIRQLRWEGDEDGAIALADAVTARESHPRLVGRALMLKLGSMHNIGRIHDIPAVVDQAFEVLDGRGEPALLAGVHALAGISASETSMERCIRHLVQGTRELEHVAVPGYEAVDAWHNLAVSYSFIGFHAEAMNLAERGYLLGQLLGHESYDHALPEVAVRRAVSFDHCGDTEGCARMLREVLRKWANRTHPGKLWRAEQHYYGYAAVRLAALGEQTVLWPELLASASSSWELADLRLLGTACAAITEGRGDEALAILEGRVHGHTLGAAEIVRLRGLAHAARGDLAAALTADRAAMRLATEIVDDLRERLVAGVRTQLDHEALRHTVEQYETEALTDPLTGLPNRRYFDKRIAEVGDSPVPTALGIIDLDDFKKVNTVHGHLGGDLVLQRVAAVIARSVRSGDFVARYGGDEFIIALPATDVAAAVEIGERIANAVESEDWDALVVGTPVSITLGWAELTETGGLAAALKDADHAMLARKASGNTRSARIPH